ncbi:large ribosomal subunit protein mL44-like [Saccoglossus kowalevskii]|uniref:Large ribosomal subunit protein mL44 n=1 Tax=Saccoglossus kowalevskii TaxID=10224 RepID=A0ABM0GKT4_SACKO|nr:PREDICTED: 39S ribosomal protein L44, mitochondrial-like [Saccoglossus kowalevskii]
MAATVACTCAYRSKTFNLVRQIRSGILWTSNPFLTDSKVRHVARWYRPYMWYLEKLKKKAERKFGVPLPVPRSEHTELPWDYDSELYAFSQRLSEDFNVETLRAAFNHREYTEDEAAKRRELRMDENIPLLNIPDNEELAEKGFIFSSEYIKSYLRSAYPKFPDEGVKSVSNYLTDVEISCHIGRNLGVYDLIRYPEFPHPEEIIQKTFFAVIGSLLQDKGADRTGIFVRDFILAQLIGKDINRFWDILDPMKRLSDYLETQKQELPESRIIRQSGASTLVAMYIVGVYSNKQILGFAPGVSLLEAEEEAARVALKNIYETNPETCAPLYIDGSRGKVYHNVAMKRLQDNNILLQLKGDNLKMEAQGEKMSI